VVFAMFPRKRQQVELPASSSHTFMNKKSTFADRVAAMRAVAEDLRNSVDIIEAEADAMAEAQKRFAAKTASGRSAKSTE